MPRTDSRERILDAAERLFAEKGMRATSLRDIGAAAKANTGSIYFHFKTKAALVREVFRRRLEPLDAERLALLDACEKAAAPKAPGLEAVLDALIAPMLRLSGGGGRGATDFMRVLGRTYSESDREFQDALYEDHGHTMDRFRAALGRALPALPDDQLALRFHFALGSVAFTMASDVTWKRLPTQRSRRGARGGKGRPASGERMLQELMPFLVAGFQAPYPHRIEGAESAA